MFGNLIKDITETVSELVEDPIGKTVDIVTQPVRDAVDIMDGFTEGELREKAALRLGADVAGGMALSDLIDWYNE